MMYLQLVNPFGIGFASRTEDSTFRSCRNLPSKRRLIPSCWRPPRAFALKSATRGVTALLAGWTIQLLSLSENGILHRCRTLLDGVARGTRFWRYGRPFAPNRLKKAAGELHRRGFRAARAPFNIEPELDSRAPGRRI